jgi:hypothetical protein
VAQRRELGRSDGGAVRTYGRINQRQGIGGTWVEVTTDANGHDDAVWITTLIQCLKLNLGESPFCANYGLPAHQAVIQQVFPDYYVAITQKQFAQYFASLLISKIPSSTPTYQVNIMTTQGAKQVFTVAT